MEARNERLFRVLGDVGNDLIATAEKRVFPRSAWRRWLPAAACLLLAAGLGLAAISYFSAPQETASAPPAETETVAMGQAEADPMESEEQEIVDQTETAAEDTVVDERAWVQPKVQLVFWDTIYYVEAQYTREEAEKALGDYLGTVESADDENCAGAAVYQRMGSEVREDYKERPVPLELFVENEAGYLYCLTYYHTVRPLMEWEAVQYRWQEGRLDELVEMFVSTMEMSLYVKQMQLEYNLHNDQTELTPEQLLHIFLVTLEMERQYGSRSADLDSYLWESGSNYVIPVEDMKKQLDKYLDDFDWQPEQIRGYDPNLNAVVMEDLTVATDSDSQRHIYLQIDPTGCSLDEEHRTLVLRVQRYSGGELLAEREYAICFTADRMVYEYILTVYPG